MESLPMVSLKPIPMILTCPACKARHVDEGDFATKLHHTHACQKCGTCWRPAVVHTVGVRFLPGFKDGPEPTLKRVLKALGFGTGNLVDEKIGWNGVLGLDGKGLPPGCEVFHCEFCRQGDLDLTKILHQPDCPVLELREVARGQP